jgi:hypothetical protein
MTHRMEDPDGYDNPREALQHEFARAPELQRNKRESLGLAKIVRATRIANGLDQLILKALEAHP